MVRLWVVFGLLDADWFIDPRLAPAAWVGRHAAVRLDPAAQALPARVLASLPEGGWFLGWLTACLNGRFILPWVCVIRVVKRIKVRDGRQAIKELNELEYINGSVYTNVWHSDYIARIDPATGRVTAWLDCRSVKPAAVRNEPESVLNGIAWDATNERLFLTGKNWPNLFEVRIRNSKP